MAKFTEYISGLFRASKSDEDQYYDEEPETERETNKNPADLSGQNLLPLNDIQVNTKDNLLSETKSSSLTKSEVSIPYWLSDEDTLRDEGVLFGLSESEPTEKTDIIQKYFSQLAAEPVSYIEQHNERIQELNLFIGKKTDRIEELKIRLNEHEAAKTDSDHHLPRTLIGLSLCIAMCIGNFFLIRQSLRPAFAESSWIALGIFLAGMFSLFGRISMFHNVETKVTWRPLLEETGLPFAAALFVFANALPYQSWLQASALFVFVLFLFLFAGKLFLSNITVLRTDLQSWLGVMRDQKRYTDDSASWEEEILVLQEEVDELRVKKWQVVREQSAAETERDRLFAKRDMLIKLFESEFFLARRMKNQLTGKQLSYIQKGE
ncbi:hypothetical protein [Dyadobacter sp. NIV53]|uniref:hypothetical protein n=1 Tax=Dyadobacter sp. NIV53 TaxID=2861765 RepID=UPI001E3B8B15|nr:hypothetical protein [Dyadobacter sp. NIV53]